MVRVFDTLSLVLIEKTVDEGRHDDTRFLKEETLLEFSDKCVEEATYPLPKHVIERNVDHLLSELSPVFRGSLEFRSGEPLRNVAN